MRGVVMAQARLARRVGVDGSTGKVIPTLILPFPRGGNGRKKLPDAD
jgi:hypothetical protein